MLGPPSVPKKLKNKNKKRFLGIRIQECKFMQSENTCTRLHLCRQVCSGNMLLPVPSAHWVSWY